MEVKTMDSHGITFDVAKTKLTVPRAPQPNPRKERYVVHSDIATPHRVKYNNGFVRAICEAYNHHHWLVLRPDDVWIAIIVQFSAFMELAGEELRKMFVDHDGQKELVVNGGGNLYSANYPQLCTDMGIQIGEKIKDPSVRDWIIPKFSTTTSKDRIVGAIALMASMKSYFSYKFCLECGIPKVTLEGTIDDWKELETRAARLLSFDTAQKSMSKWYALLGPVLRQFTKSAAGRPDIDWWQKVCSHHGGGSGPSYLSGWVTTFCVFDDKGEWVGDKTSVGSWGERIKSKWPIVDTNDLPRGTCKVDVTVDDNGTEYKCELVAGHGSYTTDDVKIRPNVEWLLRLKLPKAIPDPNDRFAKEDPNNNDYVEN